MQEKKILPRRKGVVLLSVLGCLFVFFAKTEKDAKEYEKYIGMKYNLFYS